MRYVVYVKEGESVVRHLRISAITELEVNHTDTNHSPTTFKYIFRRCNVPNEYRDVIDPSTFMFKRARCALFEVTSYQLQSGVFEKTGVESTWVNIERG